MIDIGLSESVAVSDSEPSVEVVALTSRRRFTADYNRRILEEVDRSGHGDNRADFTS